MSHNFIASLKVLKLMKVISLLSSNLVFGLVSYSVLQRRVVTHLCIYLYSDKVN